MRRVRSQFLQSVVGRLGFAVRGRGVSGGAAAARSFEGTGALTCDAPPFSRDDGQKVWSARTDSLGATSVLEVRHGVLGARAARLAVLVVALVAALALQVSAAEAQTGDRQVLLSFGTETGVLGGQVGGASGVAVNGDGVGGGEVGDVYVSNRNNQRVEVFSRTGEFRRAFGFDVVASGPHNGANEQQSVTLPGATTGGTFQLRFNGTNAAATSAAIAFDASAGQVQAALEGVANIGSGNVTVAGPAGGPYVVTFQGALGGNDVAQMTAVGALSPAGAVAIATTVGGGGVETCYPDDVCKAGAGGVAGAFGNAQGLGFEAATGNLFVASQDRRIVVYGADGEFQGAFGWGVNASAPAAELQFCTTATGCQAGTSTAGAGGFANMVNTGFAIAPDSGNLLVAERGNRRVNEFALTLDGDDHVTGVSFVRAFGWNVSPDGQPGDTPEDQLEICTTVCQASAAGTGDGQFPANTPTAIAVDDDGAIYVASGARVQVFNPDGTFREVFGPATGDCPVNGTSVFGVAIDPDTQNVFVTQMPTTTSFRLCEFLSDGTLVDASPATPAATIAGGPLPIYRDGGRTYVSTQVGFPQSAIHLIAETPPPPGVVMDPVGLGGIGGTSATFEGTVTVPASVVPLTTNYRFEHSSDGVTWRQAPFPDGIVGDGTPGSYDVSQAVGGLRPNTAYQVRLRASNPGGPSTSTPVVFTTDPVPPTVVASYVEDLQDTSARLRGVIDPHGLQTDYHFEYGTDPDELTDHAPVPDGDVGSGNVAVAVGEAVGGLEPATTYYFQLVAISGAGTTAGPQRSFTTRGAPLTTRGVELVSHPDDVGVGWTIPLWAKGTLFQVAPNGDDVFYPYSYGNEDSKTSGNIKMIGHRGSTGWAREEVTPPFFEEIYPGGTAGNGYVSGEVMYTVEDLSCSLVPSAQQLTPETSTVPRDNDGGNLFLRAGDGELTLLTGDVPTNVATAANVTVMRQNYGGFPEGAISSDCETVVFSSFYRYPGLNNIANNTNWAIYKWEDGELRDVSVLPDGSPAQSAHLGAPAAGVNRRLHAVSDDAERVYFTARSNSGADSGRAAVFLREGDETVKVSQSETAVATQTPLYQVASVSGDRVAFLANYGLSTPSSTGPTATGSACESAVAPCALYVYDVEAEALTDISATTDPANEAGAAVAGVMAASDDLQRVYFAAQGQLVEHAGRSYAGNVADGTFNVYLYDHGDLAHVGVITADDIQHQSLLLKNLGAGNTVGATPDGARLVFSSIVKLTPDGSVGVPQAYLYDAGTGELVCVSCRRDGQPTVTTPEFRPYEQESAGEVAVPRLPRGISDDGSRVVFQSMDALVPGAVEGKHNVYVWDRGAIELLTVGDLQNVGGSQGGLLTNQSEPRIIGMTPSGDDVFVTTPESLVSEDSDGVSDLYDFRVGGGFPSTPVEEPCDPLASQCQADDRSSLSPEVRSNSDGQGNAAPPVRARVRMGRLGARQRAALAAGRRVRLRVTVNRPGRVVVRGRARIGGRGRAALRGVRRARRPGAVRVPLKLSRRARRALKRSGSLRVALSVRLAGSPRPVGRSVVLRHRPSRSARRSDVGGRR